MEFSTYYFNNEHFNYYTITFINNCKGLFQVIIKNKSNVYNDGLYSEEKFIISYDELVKSKNLYKTYIVSLIFTCEKRDLDLLTYPYIIDPTKLYVRTVTNMYNKYIDYNYINIYIQDKYPTKITIDDNGKNDIIKSFYLQGFEDNGCFHFLVNNKLIDDLITNNMYKLVNYLEKSINKIEKKIYSIKKYKLFIDNISKYKGVDIDDIKKIILANICK